MSVATLSALQWCRSLQTTALVASLLSTVHTTSAHTGHRPNIVFILMDDAGMADFQSTDPLMRTPNILKLLEEGLFLNQSYVFPSCTPTRSALLTGRYPHTFGEQTGLAGITTAKFWLNMTLTTLPKEMKALGYVTHMLGQWHVHGSVCHPGLTPMGQGFDTFYGSMSGKLVSNKYHHTNWGGFYDWWDGDAVDKSANGTYSTDLTFDRMVRIIEESPTEKPFFAFNVISSLQSSSELPQRYIDRYCSHVAQKPRRIYCAAVAAVDEGIGKTITALKKKGIYNNTSFIFLSDNGGDSTNSPSSNYPLRSGKASLYEGGTRSYTVVKAPGLAETGTTWPGIVHAVDWLPTLVGMAGGKGSEDLKNRVHGMDLWNEIRYFGASARKEFLYAYDDSYFRNHSAYRLGDWKLIKGNPGRGLGWYPSYDLIASGKAKWEDLPYLQNYDGHYELYNIKSDPYERNNLASKRPDKVDEINAKMEAFLKDYPLQPLRLYSLKSRWTYPQLAKRASMTCWCQLHKRRACSDYI